MEYAIFYVGQRARAMWDPNLGEKNLRYLRGIDPSYYAHISRVHEPLLQGDSKLQAATALRIAYAQGVETLMALVCATVQAPDCIVGWMMLYLNNELRQLVTGFSSRKIVSPIHPWYAPGSWESFVHRMLGGVQCDDEQRAKLETHFARLFSRFAADFLEERQRQEYNSLKHGARPRLGGFYMNMGAQPEMGVPAPPESMIPLGGSDFGSSFFASERVGDSKVHLRPVEVSLNWMPQNLVEGLLLLEISITNVASFLKAQCGEPIEDCPLTLPAEDFMYDLPWAEHCGVTNISHRLNFDPRQIARWDEGKIREEIAAKWAASS